jgi:L-seryl-tRNA(Ser) seleniumtransferase
LKNNTDTNNKKLNLLLSKIPSVEIILQNKILKPLMLKHSRKMLTQAVRKVISEEKKNALKNGCLYSAQERINKIKEYFRKENLSFLQGVINGSGVILHTNLGRAPLGKEMLVAVQTSLQGYTNLEYDLVEGSRKLEILILQG